MQESDMLCKNLRFNENTEAEQKVVSKVCRVQFRLETVGKC